MENSYTKTPQPQASRTTSATPHAEGVFSVPVMAYTNYLPSIEAMLLGIKNTFEKTEIIPTTLWHDGLNVYFTNNEDRTVYFQAPINSVTVSKKLIGGKGRPDEYLIHVNNTWTHIYYKGDFRRIGFIANELKKYGAEVKIFRWQKVGLSAALIITMFFVVLSYLR